MHVLCGNIILMELCNMYSRSNSVHQGSLKRVTAIESDLNWFWTVPGEGYANSWIYSAQGGRSINQYSDLSPSIYHNLFRTQPDDHRDPELRGFPSSRELPSSVGFYSQSLAKRSRAKVDDSYSSGSALWSWHAWVYCPKVC